MKAVQRRAPGRSAKIVQLGGGMGRLEDWGPGEVVVEG